MTFSDLTRTIHYDQRVIVVIGSAEIIGSAEVLNNCLADYVTYSQVKEISADQGVIKVEMDI